MPAPGKLFAISDLHVGYPENRKIVARMAPESDEDWLIVAGDVAESFTDVGWALGTLRERFARVIWAPGNHELWTLPGDPVQLRGEQRYQALVRMCQALGVDTPEDPYPVWQDTVQVAPLFLLYDYTFRPPGTGTREEALASAYETGVVGRDEQFLHPDPWPSREDWCRARVEQTARRLTVRDPALPTVLVNHFPLVRQPTRILRHQHFALWCGTELTADWHVRFDALAVVYGHLHIPRRTRYDGVPFEEVSLGYPREWQPRPGSPGQLREILPRLSPVVGRPAQPGR
jgi:3',5'-cyclic AMP phosphodiesterase CpdA